MSFCQKSIFSTFIYPNILLLQIRKSGKNYPEYLSDAQQQETFVI